MITRRDWLNQAIVGSAALGLTPTFLNSLTFPAESLPLALLKRPIPSTGEELPAVGLGSSATFSQVARTEDLSGLREVFKTMTDQGASVFDTAPSYGASEQAAGTIAAELGITKKIFWATKVNVAGRGGAGADVAAAKAQIQTSIQRLKVDKVDLIQVHNLGDLPTQLGILKDMKREGKVRYIGVTTTSEGQYTELAAIMNREPIDFIGVDYAVDNREVEATILPLARQRKIGVLVYIPFGRTRLFTRVGTREVPAWAAEFDAKTWAQFFIKYVLGDPAVTCVTPATSQSKHMIDNLGGATGRLPDAAMRKRMAEYIDALPA